MPGSASGPPSGRTSASLLPGRVNHVDHASLNSHVLRRENQLLVVSVLRPEPQLPVLPVDPLHRHLLPAPEERHDHRPFRRCLVLLDDEEIPILYPRPHHALPHHPQEVAPPPGTRREQLGGQRVSLVRRHGLEPPPRGDPAHESHPPRSLPPFVGEPDHLRPPHLPYHIPLLFQLPQMVVRRLRTPQPCRSRNLAHTRRRLART